MPEGIDDLKELVGKCQKCESLNLLLFVESRIPKVFAWACMDCHNFEVVGEGVSQIKEWLDNHNKKVLEKYESADN